MAWFRNLRMYRIESAPTLDPERIENEAAAFALKPCGQLEPMSAGWAPPLGRGTEALTHTAAGTVWMRYGVEEKVLPAAVIKETVMDRIAVASEKEGRPLGRKEKLGIKDDVMLELLPRAFVKPKRIDSYLDPEAGWLMVDVASQKQADDVAALWRQTLTGLQLKTFDVENKLKTILTDWLDKKHSPQPFEFGDACQLRDDRDEGAVVRCRHQDLIASEIGAHLSAGKQVVSMSLEWQERLAFNLSTELVLSQIKALEIIDEQREELNSDDALANLDADYAFMVMEYRALLKDLIKVLDLDGKL